MFLRYIYSCVLVVAVLFSNLGMALNIHYCGEKIEKVVVGYASSINCAGDSHEDSCCDEMDDSDEDCCTNEIIKQKTNESVVKVIQLQLSTDFVAPVIYKFTPVVVTEVTLPKQLDIAFNFKSNAPPLYKLYHQYLLYA